MSYRGSTRRHRRRGGTVHLVVAPVMLAVAGAAAADLLWDNEIDENRINGRPMSPPGAPDARVVDDFTIEDTGGWVIQGVRLAVTESLGWGWGGVLEVYLYDDDDRSPGSRFDCRIGVFEHIYDGICDPWPCVEYLMEFEDLELGPGTYYLGARNPEATGSGTNYWVTSDGGQGTDAMGWYSINAGATWQQGPEDYWHFAFELYGVVVSICPADIDGSGAVDFADILAILSAWGNKGGPEDLDGSGFVDIGDLLAVLAAWGPCE